MKSKGPKTADQQWFRRVYETTPYQKLHWFSPKPHPYLAKALREGVFEAKARVLDVGCGAGTTALYLARRGFRVSAVDFAEGAVRAAMERARRARVSVDFRVADATHLPYRREEFQGVVDEGCFHSIPPSLRSRYGREMARILRAGGRFLLAWAGAESTAVPNGPHLLSLCDVLTTFESRFLFRRTEFAEREWGPLSMYHAVLERRPNTR
ncbi:MAG: methyltransferase domain-containing protein [Thermoplasmata archaeon]|nr:methyltransferase domain-containing protein [Thermoplasmata archaeon]